MLTGNKIYNFNIDFQHPFYVMLHDAALLFYNKK